VARPSKTAAIDYTVAHDLTHGLLERAVCPADTPFVLVRDADKKGLRLRVTKAGGKHWQFETRIKGKLFTRAMGEWPAVSIDQAKTEAHRLRGLTEQGIDPRDGERQQDAAKAADIAATAAKLEADKVQALTVGAIWPQYMAEGKPKRREAWKPRYRADLEGMAAPGGIKKVRGQGLTRQGPIFPLLALPLSQVNEDTLKAWHDREAKDGAHQAARALMMFRGFLRWASSKPDYRAMTDRDAGRAAAILDTLPSTKATKRKDCLEDAQLAGWFAGADTLGNRTIATYLKALLLTGSRREEMAGLRWADVDFRWNRLTLADKVNDTRIIPLSPYLAQLLATLPRINDFVFAGKSASGHIEEPRSNFAKVNQHAGVAKLTIHGLRRSFSLLGESAGAPAGAIAQIMGHSPDSIAEGYRPRSVDALRPYLAQIEAHILEQAGVTFDAKAAPGALRVVAG
jgi:integrase